MTSEPSRRIETTSAIQLPELTDLLAVSHALAASDDALLERLVRASCKPEEVYRQIRLAAPVTCHSLGNAGVCEHSSLWVIPIITNMYGKPASRQGPSVSSGAPALAAQWISEWFGFMNQARYFDFVPIYEVISRMTAGEVRGALDVLVRPAAFAVPQFKADDSEPADRCEVPELAFLLGAVTRVNDLPIFPRRVGLRAQALQRKLSGEIAFRSDDRTSAIGTYWAGVPAEFSAGLLEGVLLWVASVQASFTTEHFDFQLCGFDDVTLEWTVRCNRSNQRLLLSKHFRYSQLGSEGIESIISAVASIEGAGMSAQADFNA